MAHHRSVAVQRDWLDYAAALGGLSAIAALVIALVSLKRASDAARAAERTATAAEETAKATMAELALREMAKAPVFQLREEDHPYEEEPEHATSHVFVIQIANIGQRDAQGTVVDVYAPLGSLIRKADAPSGIGGAVLQGFQGPDPNDPTRESVCASFRLSVMRDVPSDAYIRVQFPEAGQHVVRIRVSHPDAEPLVLERDIVIR
jgi:hypothetical protein